jgi:hypothetical protein
MTTAIVSITCPSCGGHVDGLRATNVAQAVKCPYCRTELHVPRIGEVVRERVVREVIREVAPVVDPDYGSCVPSLRRRPTNPAAIFGATMIGIVILVAMVCAQQHEADHVIDDMHAKDAAKDACRVDCETTCVSAGDKENGRGYDPEMDRVMKEADVMLCEAKCQTDHDCIGTSPHERERLLHH